MSLFQYLICLLVIVWLYWLWTRRQYYAKMLELPGPLGYPFIGIDLSRCEEILYKLEKYFDHYGSLIYTWIGTSPALLVIEPDIVRDILTSPSCINKSFFYKGVDIAIGKGLISLRDPEWSFHRKHLNPTFSHKILRSFMAIFNEEYNDLVKTFRDIANKNENFDLITTSRDATLNIALRTTMGKSASQDSRDSQRNLLKSYYCVIENMARISFSPWLKNDLAQKFVGIYGPLNEAKAEIEQFIRSLIIAKLDNKVAHPQLPGAANIFIDQVIDLSKSNIFSKQNMEDESNTIVMGAFETTANAISFTLILLAMFPEYQQQAYEELLSIFPESGEFEVTYANIKDMVYVDRVINETMRLLPPVPFVARENTRDIVLSNGVLLPAGVQLAIDIYNLHRRKDIWGPEADTFNPDNFLPHNMEGKHPYAFIPFSKGSRNCIGWKYALMSTKVALAKLLRNFRFSTDFQYKDLKCVENIAMRLKEVPSLRIHKREK